MSQPQGQTKVFDRAVSLMDNIMFSKEAIGVNELARLCNFNVTTAYRVLQILCDKGWIYKNHENRYLVGYKLSNISIKRNFYKALSEVAHYTMKRISKQAFQAVNLVIRENEKCYILHQTRTERIVDYVPPVGTSIPIYASACGKVLLANTPNIVRDLIIDSLEMIPLTSNTLVDRDDLLKELNACRENGFALDRHESQQGGFCIAVPIVSNTQEVIAAISFSGIIGNVPQEEIDRYCEILKKASKEISENLFRLENEV